MFVGNRDVCRLVASYLNQEICDPSMFFVAFYYNTPQSQTKLSFLSPRALDGELRLLPPLDWSLENSRDERGRINTGRDMLLNVLGVGESTLPTCPLTPPLRSTLAPLVFPLLPELLLEDDILSFSLLMPLLLELLRCPGRSEGNRPPDPLSDLEDGIRFLRGELGCGEEERRGRATDTKRHSGSRGGCTCCCCCCWLVQKTRLSTGQAHW
jgi:hypothetical protein